MSLTREDILAQTMVTLPDGSVMSLTRDGLSLRAVALPGGVSPDFMPLLSAAGMMFSQIDQTITVLDSVVELLERHGGDALASPIITLLGSLRMSQACAIEGTSVVAARLPPQK